MAKKDNKGFTIIEVALVLAIAGLIFLVVFLALPALQRSQRDTARRQDVGRVVSALQAYASDNQSSVPAVTGTTSIYWNSSAAVNAWVTGSATGTTKDTVLGGYIGALAQATQINMTATAGNTATTSMIVITVSAVCGSGGTVVTSGTGLNGKVPSSRDAAVQFQLESGGTYCADM